MAQRRAFFDPESCNRSSVDKCATKPHAHRTAGTRQGEDAGFGSVPLEMVSIGVMTIASTM